MRRSRRASRSAGTGAAPGKARVLAQAPQRQQRQPGQPEGAEEQWDDADRELWIAIDKGYFRDDENVLFLHTGGSPALSAYSDSVLD